MKKLLVLLGLSTFSYAAKVPLVSHSHVYGYIDANQTVYIPVGDTVISSSTVEAHQQVPFYKAGTFSGMYVRLEENNLTGSYTCSLRINGATGNSTVTLAAGVKIGTDTTHTDHINSGDKVDYVCTTGAGTNVLPVANLINFTPDDGSYYQRFSPAAPAGGYILTNGYQPYYSNITGIMGQNFYDHHTFHVMRTSGTFQNLAVYVSTNARVNYTHVALYKNGANTGLAVRINPGQWGLIEQTTTTVNVVVGDTVAISMNGVDGADSNALNFRLFSMEFVNNTGLFEWSLGTDDKPQNAGDTYTMPHKGALTFGGDEYLMQANSTGTLSNLCVYIGQNDVNNASTVKVRKDAVTDAGITVTIPAASTGTFCDNSGTVSFVSTNTWGYIGNSPAGTGTLYYSSIMGKFTLTGQTSSGSTGRPIITPSLPIVPVSTTKQFSSTATVSWSLLPGSTGTIDSSGLYTAPGPIRAKQSIYGCVVSPQDMITLTNISSLPVDTSSTNYMRSQAGDAQIALEPDMPVNIYSNATSSQTLAFRYTPSNDGDYKVADVYDLRMENGIFADKDVDKDTHILAIDKDSCIASEQYKLYPIGTEAACLTCNSQSGVAFPNRYNFVQGTTAGGLPIITHIITYRDMRDCVDRGIPISHALRMSFAIGILANSHKWPAVAHATDGGQLPFGTYVRLVSTYTPTGSVAAQCIQQALKDYGAVLDDGGINGHIQIEQAAIGDYDLFSVMSELAGISEFKVKNLEAVDVSSLQDTDTASPTYGYGRVSSTNSYVAPSQSAVVKATNLTDGTTAIMPIIIQPVTIGTEQEVGYTFFPGTPQTQLPVWVHGASDTTFSCSMSPTLGSLTSGGLYTAPSTSFTRSSTTVTCTATADPTNARVSFGVTVTSGTVRTRLANATNTDYTAADGTKWYIDYGNFWRLQGRANGDWRGQTFSGGPEPQAMVEAQYVNDGSGDMLHHMFVPNGTYQINLYFAVGDAFAAGDWQFAIDAQDTIYSGSSATTLSGNGAWTFFGLTGKKVDLCDIIGSCTSDTVGTVTLNVTVSDNNLNFWIRHLTINGGSSKPSLLNAFDITQTSSASSSSTGSVRFRGGIKIGGGVKVR